jgi:hypothetical protein
MRDSQTKNLFEEPKELAPQGASVSVRELKAELNELEADANQKVRKLKLTRSAYEDRWDELLPVLDKIQTLLSERGLNYKRGNPDRMLTWTQWWRNFRSTHKLEVGFRHIQKKLKKLREHRNKSASETRRSPAEKRAQHVAKEFGSELMRAVKQGESLADALDKALRVTLPSRTLKQLVRLLASRRIGPSGSRNDRLSGSASDAVKLAG